MPWLEFEFATSWSTGKRMITELTSQVKSKQQSHYPNKVFSSAEASYWFSSLILLLESPCACFDCLKIELK